MRVRVGKGEGGVFFKSENVNFFSKYSTHGWFNSFKLVIVDTTAAPVLYIVGQ